nr:uncharacterized protein LOC117692007 [Crassostrea gigas]
MEQQRRGSHLLFGTFLYYLVRLYETEKIDGYKFPVYSTQLCPKNETEWIKRSSDLNCTEHNGYMCLPNQDFTELLEFCYTEPKVRIQKGVCLFLVKGVSKVDSYDCCKFNDGCPISFYLSDKSFEHQACLSIGNGCFLAEPSCERPTSTILQKPTEQIPTGDVPSNDTYTGNWVLAIIPVSILILIIIMVLFIIKKKWSVCKRRNDEEQASEIELEPFLNVKPLNENNPTETVNVGPDDAGEYRLNYIQKVNIPSYTVF